MAQKAFQPVVELIRGGTAESFHSGAIAVVDFSGNLVASFGDPEWISFLRSTAKPFQALPFIEAGGDKHFQMSPKEIAVICASHSGTDEHVEIIRALGAKIGINESALKCGSHPPYHLPTLKNLILRGEEPTPIRHNCSGKHTGMLGYAKILGAPLENYLDRDHPVQQEILSVFAEMCGLEISEVALGTDGCSAPNFATPCFSAALAWARLVDPRQLHDTRAGACRTLTTAMTAHPEMVAGPGRLDTALMHAAGGRILAKAGAEGYQGIGILPGVRSKNSPGLGIAIKIADGDHRGSVRPVVVLEILRQLGLLDDSLQKELAAFGPEVEIRNWRGIVVGKMRPVFDLEIK